MTLHFPWLNAPRWLAHAPINRAMTLVLGIIGVSLLFGALRVVDAAFSGGLATAPAAMVEPGVASVPAAVTTMGGEAASSASRAIDANLVEVPPAAAEAISL